MSSSPTPDNPEQPRVVPDQPLYPPGQPSYPLPGAPPPGYQPYAQPSQPYPPGNPSSQPYPPPYPPAGHPSQPYPPQYPPTGQPSQPYAYPPAMQPYPYPQPSPSQPYFGQSAPWPLAPDGTPLPPPMAPVGGATWGQSWPLWGWLLGGVVLAGVAALLFVTGSDWAAGARMASITLFIGSLVVLATLGLRAAGGLFAPTNARRTTQILGTSLTGVILLIIASGGLIFQAPLHLAQARSLESAHNYVAAINEFQMGGAGGEDLARTYNEWGEDIAAHGDYQTAIQKFETVLTTYSAVGDQVARAQADEASAYDNLAEHALSGGDYQDAITYFQVLVSKFPNSAQARQAHGDYARALYGLGQQELQTGGNSGCASALTTYQQLASNFSDTTQGAEAATALKAPQPIIGKVTGNLSPPDGDSLVMLLGHVSGTDFSATAGTVVDLTTGDFAFQPIPQGSYNLAIVLGTVSGGTLTPDPNYTIGVVVDQNEQPFTITTVPLCGTDVGSINHTVNGQSTPGIIGLSLIGNHALSVAWHGADEHLRPLARRTLLARVAHT